jgi:hypothetical protein
VLSDADPTGTETPGLASDIAGYFPASDAWRQLTGHATTQHLTIETAVVPDAWADAVAQDRSGTIVDGMIAVTIDATRYRTGTVSGQEATSEHPVSFTVFLACEPAFDDCHTLRLSELDNPPRGPGAVVLKILVVLAILALCVGPATALVGVGVLMNPAANASCGPGRR